MGRAKTRKLNRALRRLAGRNGIKPESVMGSTRLARVISIYYTDLLRHAPLFSKRFQGRSFVGVDFGFGPDRSVITVVRNLDLPQPIHELKGLDVPPLPGVSGPYTLKIKEPSHGQE